MSLQQMKVVECSLWIV